MKYALEVISAEDRERVFKDLELLDKKSGHGLRQCRSLDPRRT